MSDSDDSDTYTDYLKSRQAAVQKKRPSTAAYNSDSDDDYVPVKPVAKKKREVQIVDDEDDSFVEKNSHDQHLKSKIDEMEEQYRKQLYSKDEFMISCKGSSNSNNVLTKAMRMCDAIDEGDGIEVEEVDGQDADSSMCKQFIPVTIEILDCEMCKNGKQRYEVPHEGSFDEVRKKLASVWKCQVDAVGLSLNGETIPDAATPKSLGIRALQIPHPVIEAFKREVAPREVFSVESTPGPESISLKVQIQNRKKPVYVIVTESTTILQIKEQIVIALSEEKDSVIVTTEQMKVMFDDDYLTDETATCQSLGFEDADCLDIYI